MARLKIKGLPELLEVNENDARKYVMEKNAGNISPDDNINIGTFSGESRQVVAVLLDNTETYDDRFAIQVQELQEYRNQFVLLSPQEKAEELRPVFELFYESITGTQPDKELAEEARKDIEAFFAFNENRTFPDLDVWKKRISADHGIFMSQYHAGVCRMLERCMAEDIVQTNNVLLNRVQQNIEGKEVAEEQETLGEDTGTPTKEDHMEGRSETAENVQ